jgi:hypothetical protein
MKLDAKTLNTDNIETMGKVTKMKLSDNAQAQIFNMFTKNVYSDPIGTVIREITSNCFDSHIEAGVDHPVIVRMHISDDDNYISFIDRGVGMSPDRVENIYGTYFESTKRDTNNEIGGFGIGGKTPLAYTNAFFVITRFEGVEYVYNIFLGNDSPVIELISQQSTNKGNGTEVKVPVRINDVVEFQRKAKRQLFYFENVIFEGFDNDIVQNDYRIIKGKTFLYRGSDYSQAMHVCYGRVAYPIDFDALGLSEYEHRVPVAINIPIGELEGTGVTVSRESLDYSEANKRILKKKINEVKDELIGMLCKQHENVQTLTDYYHAISEERTLKFPNGDKVSLSYLDFELPTTNFTNFKFKDLPKIPNVNNVLSYLTDVKMFGKKGKKWDAKWDTTLGKVKNYDNIFYTYDCDMKMVRNKQTYFRTFGNNGDQFWLVKPKDLNDELTVNALFTYFGIHKPNVGLGYQKLVSLSDKKALSLIKEFQTALLDIVAEYCHEYETTEVSQEWLDARKNLNKISVADGEIVINVRDAFGYGNDKVILKHLNTFKGRIYYGFRDDEYDMQDAKRVFSILTNTDKSIARAHAIGSNSTWKSDDKYGTLFIQISKQNEKYMKMLGHKKALHVSTFFKTFVVRKIDRILNSRFLSTVNARMSNINTLTRNREVMEIVAPDALNKYKELQERIHDMGGYTTIMDHTFNAICSRLPEMKIDKQVPKFNFENELSELEKIDKKLENALKYVSIPYSFDAEQDAKLIDIINFAMNS